ncbi:MAG: MerR family transcriptional regulator, thiopeptide resistance regulator [Actinomycetota bacterium]|jgi:DNA-binding transcriptional MerR regulator|nr:MerR family transcriptional regulator, thiopeptide resistance regulator [Actinomycetota bacterium]
MAWSTAEVVEMSGVTSRTLRHYDSIGLLEPAHVGTNGYRYYGEEQLLRLQQILVLRRLGVGLAEIAVALDAEPDVVSALRRHHARLLGERDRLGRLADTVARTVAELERSADQEVGTEMTTQRINRPENLFEGFDPSDYDAEAAEKWPVEHEQSRAVADGFTPEQLEAGQREMTAKMIRMAELMVAGIPADDPVVQEEVDWHYRSVARFWTPNAAAWTHLGRMYVDDERFRANYEGIAEGLAEYQCAAMEAYAEARLD